MALTVSEKSGSFTPVPEGVHRAVCIGLYDLGTHMNEQFKKEQEKVLIVWELPDENIEVNGEYVPMRQSKQYTASLSEKSSLRKDLEAWRGRTFTKEELDGFNLHNILGKCCQLQIIHVTVGDKTYANIAAIMALPKGMPPFKAVSEIQYFDFSEHTAIPDTTPEWIANKIRASKEYRAYSVPSENLPSEDGEPIPEPF